jgi:hypothetical protein
MGFFQKKLYKMFPLDEMMKYSKLRFMHSNIHHYLPFSCAQLWMFKRDHNQKWSVAKCRFGLRIPTHHSVRIYQAPPSVFFPSKFGRKKMTKIGPMG